MRLQSIAIGDILSSDFRQKPFKETIVNRATQEFIDHHTGCDTVSDICFDLGSFRTGLKFV